MRSRYLSVISYDNSHSFLFQRFCLPFKQQQCANDETPTANKMNSQ
ncbi:Uncharacterised protein [Serratia liquefaciens]|nr:hypothetical protein SFB10_0114 [Serratia liquefaciens]CAI1061662.1 Uncharacterised protein [Serratia liquefaciens]CAI1088426.1 Uncharacterised protein [Serratia liquefaciens]CAI1112689.1 Uncharacterised protein [Serratia liquefaciens]CAI1141442.1 Uncharacterised protein [Serratia liquefaciens]